MMGRRAARPRCGLNGSALRPRPPAKMPAGMLATRHPSASTYVVADRCVCRSRISGVLVQWLIDPDRAPSAADLARGLQAIAGQVAPAS